MSKHLASHGNKLLHGRNVPSSFAFQQLSQIQLDIEPFEDKSLEQNREAKDLETYLKSLHGWVERRKRAIPKYRTAKGEIPKSRPLWKPLYNYDRTKTTEVDTRPSYHKFMENMREANEELFNELTEPLDVEELIDLKWLHLHENKHSPKLMSDDEYPDWVWELVPESRKYWWTDLVQTPFENLSQTEKWQLLRKWRKTLMVCNNMWAKSHLGRLGKVRPRYNDPWPKPLTKMDMTVYQKNDVFYQESVRKLKILNRKTKGKRRLESSMDYLANKNLITAEMENDAYALEMADVVAEDEADHDLEQDFNLMDLAKYYGIDDNEQNINVDQDSNTEYGVVYNVEPNNTE